MGTELYYLLKVRGLKENMDYLQIRNNSFLLLANLKWTVPYKSIERFFGEGERSEKIVAIGESIPYDILTKIEV
jgi:hypothetical protein